MANAEIKTLNFFQGQTVTPPDTTQPITVGDAVSSNQATTLAQLNSAVATLVASIATKVAKSGDTMSGILNMGTNKITSLANGTLSTDAVNKGQMDGGDTAAIASAVATAEAYTDTKITALINGSPTALDTLNELAAALGNDPSFATTVSTALGNRLRVDTAAQGLNSTQKTNAKTNIDLDHVENYSAAELASLVQTLTNKTLTAPVINSPTGIVKGDVGLGNVDNTSDATKNAATATLTNKTFDKFILQEQVDSASTGSNATLATPTKGVLKLTNASLASIDMIPAVSGLPFMLINKTGAAITLNNLTGATAANQVETGTGANLTLANNASLWLYYSPTVARYLVIGGSGSGGNSASKVIFPIWKKLGTLSPDSVFVDGMEIEDFSNTDTQEMYATVKVPESYAGGSLIALYGLSFFTPITTGNVLFRTQATLLRGGSTIIGSYANIRTSINSQVAVAGSANQLKEVGALDLTDTAGLINGVAVLAGDKIRIRLYRDITNETSGLAGNARLLLDAAEIKL